MATKIRRDLVNRILSDLGVTGTGEEADVEPFDDIEQRVRTTLAELNAREIVDVPDLNAIPEEIFEPLVEYMVLRAGPGYGRVGMSEAERIGIEDRLTDVVRQRAQRKTLSTDPLLRQTRRGAAFNFKTGM